MRFQELGNEIRRARLAKALTQAQLARQAGVSRTTLNQLENGLFPNLGFRKIEAILECLDLSLAIERRSTRPDSVKMSATSSSVSFRDPLTEEELVKTLITGKIPAGKRPHLRTLLDEASPSLLTALVTEAKRWTRPGRVEKNLKSIARNIGSTRRIEDWLKTG